MNQHNQEIYRTTSARTGKMMAIMLGICIVGGVIFFSMWDYWTSTQAPVVAQMAGESEHELAPGVATGKHMEVTLNFIESSDFRTLAFNALPGEEGHNPEFRVKSGDEITFSAVNAGKSFHAFGIVSDPENFNNILWNSAIAAASNPLKPGESGSVTFTAGAPGTYYYICTVPGHALQGMQGSFIVE
jgi:nitrite reductase (NO-forming)